ncbi:MAG: DctP family TRAP transporter solute-binding subunit [Syntrophobacteraceae bacterium]|nr:DctP family TRAP transporter solute-binding subunit [Syntrophobacteraceae bacterium]
MNHLLRSLVFLSVFLLTATDVQVRQKTYRFGYILSTQSQLGAGAKAFADEVARRTGGEIKIEQQPNAALGGEVEMLNGLELGTVDFAFITGAALPNIIPEMGVFDIPFLFRDVNQARDVLDSPLGLYYLEKFKAKNMIALAWGENGLRHLTNSIRPIRTPEDVKGLKLRLPQSDCMLIGFKTLGAQTVSLPFPQVFGALQSGQIDGQENPLSTIISSGFAKVQKYLSLTGHVYDPAVILVSKDTRDEFSPAEQAILYEAARMGAKASREFNEKMEKTGVDILRRQGVEVVDKIDRAKFRAAVLPAFSEYQKMYGANVIKQIQDMK